MENCIAAGVSRPRFSAFEKNANVSPTGALTTALARSSVLAVVAAAVNDGDDAIVQDVVERRIKRREPPVEPARRQLPRLDTLARQEHDGRLSEDRLEGNRRHRQNGGTLQRPPQSPREASRRHLLGGYGVHRTGVARIRQRGGHDRDEIVQVNPREVLISRSDGAPGAHEKWRQHLRERAARPAQHDAGAQEHDARTEVLRVPRGRFPADAELREEVVAVCRHFGEAFAAAVAVIADGAARHEHAAPHAGRSHRVNELFGQRHTALLEPCAPGRRPPFADEGLSGEVDDSVAAAQYVHGRAASQRTGDDLDVRAKQCARPGRRPYPRDDGVAVALKARHERPADETRRACDEDAHRSGPRDPHAIDCR